MTSPTFIGLVNRILQIANEKLFHLVEILLQDLPVFQTSRFALIGLDDFGFARVLRRLGVLVENAEVAGEIRASKFVSCEFIGDIVALRDFIEYAAFARIARVKRAFVKLDAFAQAFDEAETVVIHRGFHHRQNVIRIRGRRARDKRGTGGDGLFERIDRIIDRAPNVGLALEAERRRGRSLFLGEAVNPVVHHAIGHLDVLARGVGKMIAANRKRIAVAAEHEHVQVGT